MKQFFKKHQFLIIAFLAIIAAFISYRNDEFDLAIIIALGGLIYIANHLFMPKGTFIKWFWGEHLFFYLAVTAGLYGVVIVMIKEPNYYVAIALVIGHLAGTYFWQREVQKQWAGIKRTEKLTQTNSGIAQPKLLFVRNWLNKLVDSQKD